MWNRNDQTICAISTPPGVGGIAVIRVSGPRAAAICSQFSKSISKKEADGGALESHRAYFTAFYERSGKPEAPGPFGHKVDEVVLTYFAAGRSFTGDEVVEISCHGSPFITRQILDLLVQGGARIAEKGEFTYRAFMNGRLDLVQAESVLSLIESQGRDSARLALRQLDGHISREFESLISDLTWCLAHIEASIDFIEQGIEVVDPAVLIRRLQGVARGLERLLESYRSGRLVRDGLKLVLVGEPNVGKSSLLNQLLLNDRAIVTPIAGTTRDVIEGEVVHDGIKFNISDTAGLRETRDQVEVIGIDRSRKEAEKADLLGFVFDCTAGDWERSVQLAKQLPGARKIFLLNKADAVSEAQREILRQDLTAKNAGITAGNLLFTSALDPAVRNDVFALARRTVGGLDFLGEAVISSARQFEQADYAFEMISKSLAELGENAGAEFVAMYLKEALISLQKILGQVYDDQIMDRVFKEFCLGK